MEATKAMDAIKAKRAMEAIKAMDAMKAKSAKEVHNSLKRQMYVVPSLKIQEI